MRASVRSRRGPRRRARTCADAHRRRLGQGRARRAHGRASDAVRRRPAYEHGAAPGLRPRRGPPRRRCRRRGRGRDPVRRRGRRRGRRGRLRDAARGDHAARCGGTRAPLVHERFGTNLVFEIERGDRRADRGGDGRGREGRGARPHQQPPVRQSDRAARLSVRLRCRARPLHALCDHAAAALPAPLARALHAAHPEHRIR